MWSLSIATQITATSLIAWRIWSTHTNIVGPYGNLRAISVIWILVESGAVLGVTHVFILAFYLIKVITNGILNNMMVQLCVSKSYSHFDT